MRQAARQTLQRHLQRINLLTMGTSMLVLVFLTTLVAFITALYGKVDNTRVQARILAENAAAALMFQDGQAAQALLASLRNSPDYRRAGIYHITGRALAEYARPGEPATPPNLATDQEGFKIQGQALDLVQPVLFEHQRVGSLYLGGGPHPPFTGRSSSRRGCPPPPSCWR